MRPAGIAIWLLLPCLGMGWLMAWHSPNHAVRVSPRVSLADVTEPWSIEDMQAWLVQRGADIEIDGIWGKQTQAALEDVYCTMSAERRTK